MLTLPFKLLFALAGLAFAGAVGYGAAVGERGGLVLLAALGFVAAGLGLASLLASDTAPYVAPDAPAPDPRATTPGAPARSSVFPLLSASAVGVVAVGAAVEAALVYVGVGLGVVAALAWFGRAWSEHPSWTPRVRDRVDYRLLVPVGLPLAMIGLTAVIAISLSRVLLAVDKSASTVIAMVVAVAVLAVFALIATRPRVGSSALAVLAAVAGLSVLGAGFAGAAQGERHFEEHGHGEFEIEIEAEDVQFSTDELVVPAEESINLVFENHDEDIFHNVAVYDSDDPDATPLFNGVGFAGPERHDYEFETPEEGTYVFVCDFHANMKGRLIVEENPDADH